ncbi:MAG: ATP-dependent helicase [Firmicutes bacterium]|nr:ATP-dependent helicase [Bacillota bacterium]
MVDRSSEITGDTIVSEQDWLRRLDRELNQAQYEFVTLSAPAILGLAGPGSGKTRALMYRAAHLIKNGVPPGSMMLLTFTNKAAGEMKERLEKLIGYLPKGLWAGTFHSTGARILRRHAPLLGRTGQFTILDEVDSNRLLRQLVDSLPFKIDRDGRNLLLKRRFLEKVISRHRNSNLTVEQVILEYYPRQVEYTELIERLGRMYTERKRESNSFDFDDLLICWRDLFRDHPRVKAEYRERFRHLLVDEFQDTNRIQAELVDQFAGAASICVVGDDAQSIYAFRQAEVKNIVTFPDKYPRCQVIRMERNYRSTPEIVSLADRSIAINREQLKKKLYSSNPPGEKPVLVQARDVYQEASLVGYLVGELHSFGVPYKEIAVLYRSSYLSSGVEFELMRRQLRYRTFGGLRFLQKGHIKDVTAYLRVLYNPEDRVSWQRVVTLQPGIGEATFETLWKEWSRFPDRLQAMLSGKVSPPRGAAGWERLRETYLDLVTPGLTLPAMIDIVLQKNYDAILEKSYPDQFEERRQGIERLADYGARFASLGQFLDTISLDDSIYSDGSLPSTDRGFLTLSTIHSAKGKEWEAVFVIGLNEGQFPSSRIDSSLVEEERRLFYVAVTRARRYLYLLSYRQDHRQWGAAPLIPSLFLRELPPETYQVLEPDPEF